MSWFASAHCSSSLQSSEEGGGTKKLCDLTCKHLMSLCFKDEKKRRTDESGRQTPRHAPFPVLHCSCLKPLFTTGSCHPIVSATSTTSNSSWSQVSTRSPAIRRLANTTATGGQLSILEIRRRIGFSLCHRRRASHRKNKRKTQTFSWSSAAASARRSS